MDNQKQLIKKGKSGLMEFKGAKTWLSQYSEISVSTPTEARSLRTPTLNRAKNEVGEVQAQAVVFLEISKIVNFINVGKTMSDHQISDTVRMIMQDYGQLTLADLSLFGKRYRAGRYGKSYDRLDGQTIIMGIEEYMREKTEEMESVNFERHNNLKKASGLAEMHPDVISAIKAAIGSSKEKEVLKTSKIKSNPNDRIQIWRAQFINLSRKYGIRSGVTMIKIGNTIMDFEKFIERKFKNASR